MKNEIAYYPLNDMRLVVEVGGTSNLLRLVALLLDDVSWEKRKAES
jgi:hypothetical protein